MKPMLIKGWEKTRLRRTWDDDFQFATLETNTTIVLFTTMLEIKEAINVVDDFNPTKKKLQLSWNSACNTHQPQLQT